MVSCVHRKCQTRAGVSGDVSKTLECATITDSKFSNRVLEWMTSKCTSINGVTMRLEQFDFYLNRCKWELPDQHIANCILPPELFLISLMYRIHYLSTVNRESFWLCWETWLNKCHLQIIKNLHWSWFVFYNSSDKKMWGIGFL